MDFSLTHVNKTCSFVVTEELINLEELPLLED
jgi:hypothetical protein